MVSKLVAGRARHGALRLGARNRDGAIVPIPDCIVTDADLNNLGKQITFLLDRLQIFPYTPKHKSGVRNIVMRKSALNGRILVTIVATRRTFHLESLAEHIAELSFNIQGVHLHLNNEQGNAIFVRDNQGRAKTSVLYGHRTLRERVGGTDYIMGPGDFFQVNLEVAHILRNAVVEFSKRFSKYPMVDLYCGVGFFALELAKVHGWCVGIEMVDAAIWNAKMAAQEQNINAEFITGDVYDEVDIVQQRIGKSSPFIVVDPARRGLEEGVVEEIDAMNPCAVAYVSCSTRSLVRDIERFQALGWKLESCSWYDMFPNTVHVEALALFIPPKSRKLNEMTRIPQKRRVQQRIKSKLNESNEKE